MLSSIFLLPKMSILQRLQEQFDKDYSDHSVEHILANVQSKCRQHVEMFIYDPKKMDWYLFAAVEPSCNAYTIFTIVAIYLLD